MEWIVEAETLGDLVDGLWTGGKRLVRCKDCKWLVTKEETGFHLCGLEKFETMRDLTDYCSMGERKDK